MRWLENDFGRNGIHARLFSVGSCMCIEWALVAAAPVYTRATDMRSGNDLLSPFHPVCSIRTAGDKFPVNREEVKNNRSRPTEEDV